MLFSELNDSKNEVFSESFAYAAESNIAVSAADFLTRFGTGSNGINKTYPNFGNIFRYFRS